MSDPIMDSVSTTEEGVVSLCCTRWFRRLPRDHQKALEMSTRMTASQQEEALSKSDGGTVFHSTYDGSRRRNHLFVEEQSLFYFDALETLADDNNNGVEIYPIITTNYKRQAPFVSIQQPETLLSVRARQQQQQEEQEGEINTEKPNNNSDDNLVSAVFPTEAQQLSNNQKVAATENQLKTSKRIQNILLRNSVKTVQVMESPRVKIEERGYPGGLTVEELEIVKRFYSEIKIRDVELAEIVFSLRDVEEEPYAICRFLRAFNFDADQVLEKLESMKDAWNKAKQAQFYPDVSKALGAPFDVFLAQYPVVSFGNAKNGCGVNYNKVGKTQPEGIFCITTLERMEAFFWNKFLHQFKEQMKKAQGRDPNVVRAEVVSVMDLEGLSSSVINDQSMEALKVSSFITNFFPETLHCMLVLNAPSFFSYFWPVIKRTLNPRTAKRIHIFSNKQRGLNKLYELVDKSEIPTDYGGTSNMSIAESVRELAGLSDNGVKRQTLELLYLKKRAGKTKLMNFELAMGESMNIDIYTRSCSSSSFSIIQKANNSSVVIADVKVQSSSSPPEEAKDGNNSADVAAPSAPLPRATTIGTITGPGKFIVEGKDIDDATPEQYAYSRGYFLFVGNIS